MAKVPYHLSLADTCLWAIKTPAQMCVMKEEPARYTLIFSFAAGGKRVL